MEEKPNILFILIDALRARNLGCYGYHKPTSPNIDKIAKEGVLFKQAYCCIPATDPSLTSIFSGRYPAHHGIIRHGNQLDKDEIKNLDRTGTTLLPEILRKNGYKTAAIDWLGRWHQRGYDYYSGIHEVEKSSSASFIKSHINLFPTSVQNFLRETYTRIFQKNIRQNPKGASITTDKAINALKDIVNERFFLFVHYWAVHTAYNAPQEYLTKFYDGNGSEKISEFMRRISNPKYNPKLRQYIEGQFLGHYQKKPKTLDEIIARYNGAINYVDYNIGRLLHFLDDHGILDNTFIVVTSDHGESLTEHQFYFTHAGLYDETFHVPLIFRYPKRFSSNTRIDGLVQHVDFLPTVLELLGLDIDYDMDGTSLMPLIDGEKDSLRSAVYGEEIHNERKRAIRTKNYKYIYALSKAEARCKMCGQIHGGIEELYDLNIDPKEERNIITEKRDVAEKLKKELLEWVNRLENKRHTHKKEGIKARIERLKGRGIV